jgi:hypothetical protein
MGWIARNFGNKKRPVKSARTSPGKAEPLPYPAVSVYSKVNCCEAANRLEGQKFLAAHAPQLPLGGCSQPESCQCRYRHMDDRRQDLRRDTDVGLPPRAFVERERRSRRDRRRQTPNGQSLARPL